MKITHAKVTHQNERVVSYEKHCVNIADLINDSDEDYSPRLLSVDWEHVKYEHATDSIPEYSIKNVQQTHCDNDRCFSIWQRLCN